MDTEERLTKMAEYNIEEQQINDALKWYNSRSIDVVRTDFETGNVLSVVVDGINLELSIEEVLYRAENWNEEIA